MFNKGQKVLYGNQPATIVEPVFYDDDPTELWGYSINIGKNNFYVSEDEIEPYNE